MSPFLAALAAIDPTIKFWRLDGDVHEELAAWIETEGLIYEDDGDTEEGVAAFLQFRNATLRAISGCPEPLDLRNAELTLGDVMAYVHQAISFKLLVAEVVNDMFYSA